MIKGRLISSQRYLCPKIVSDRVARFSNFIVNVYPVVLRGVQYTVLMDGHHNYAAARQRGIAPDYRPVGKKVARILAGMSDGAIQSLFINNLTDADYYDVETGQVIEALLPLDTREKFLVHQGNQWIFNKS